MAAPKVYLSPAMHRANPCVYPRPDGQQCYEALENNEYIDILEPILNRCGIETKRGYRRVPLSNEDGDTIMRQNVAESDAWGADVHYVSHTNASANGKGNSRGCFPMYYTYSKNGKKLGEIMVKYRKQIYPRTVKLVANSKWYELYKPKAVSYYEEHVFHDNMEDATWFHTHMKEIAESAAKGLCEWFGIPYVEEDERGTCWWETFANTPQSGAASSMSTYYAAYRAGDFLINPSLGYVYEVTNVTVSGNTSGIQYEYKGTLNWLEGAGGADKPAEPANPTPGELLVKIMNSSDGVSGTWELVK